MAVQDQSPSQKIELKQCDSCKRSLPQNGHFGILRSSKDGYNPTCKDCRRYLRNQTYHRGKYLGTVFPLRANNRKIIAFRDSTKLRGLSLITRENFTIELEFRPSLMKMELVNSCGVSKDIYFCATDQKEEFLEFVIDFLAKKRIRLTNGQDNFII